jgi:hypothetical protein
MTKQEECIAACVPAKGAIALRINGLSEPKSKPLPLALREPRMWLIQALREWEAEVSDG